MATYYPLSDDAGTKINQMRLENPIEKSLSEKDTLVFDVVSKSRFPLDARSVYSWFGRYSNPKKALSRREVLENANSIINAGGKLAVYLNGQEVTEYATKLVDELRAGDLSLDDLPSLRDFIGKIDPRWASIYRHSNP